MRILLLTTTLLALFCGNVFASNASNNASVFNVSSASLTLSISTTIPNHVYPSAGIKINTPGYGLSSAGSECTMANNGYCLFSVSNTHPKTIHLSGHSGSVNMTLCLNGQGPNSCQQYTTQISAGYSKAYIANYNNNLITKCSIDSTGNLLSCENAGGNNDYNFGGPAGITLNSAGTTAYVTNMGAGNIAACTINPQDGTFSSCSDSGAEHFFFQPLGIALNPAGTIAYVADLSDGSISLCQINSSGLFSSCQRHHLQGVVTAAGIAINSAGTLAYITNYFNSTVSKCAIDGTTGELSSCTDSGNTGVAFESPDGIALNTAGTMAYIVNYGHGGASQCPINLDGSFGACQYTAGGNVSNPAGIILNDGQNYSYISDNGSGTIYKCQVESDGQLDNCTDSGATLTNGPFYMALAH